MSLQTRQPFEFGVADEAAFRAAFATHVGGTTPTNDSAVVALDWIFSPVGPLVLGATNEAVVVLEFSGVDQLESQLARLRAHFGCPLIHAVDQPLLIELRDQLAEYFAGTRREFQLPLSYRGSSFQERVWSALLRIPYGETCSYGFIAKTLGDTKAMRAVGAANGLNPIAIVIPCHRVVNANGALGGYGGGLWRKQMLLDLEQGQGRLF